jgi:UDP-glucuronate 4-epimerase
MKVLVTGAAGFIGFHLTLALIERGDTVLGLDNLNDYYDPDLKKLRLSKINEHSRSDNFSFIKADISDREFMCSLFQQNQFDVVVNLAAQAGVRYSIENPSAYIDSNIVGFANILEGCRASKVRHLVYASSSSVYGMNIKQPFNINDRVDYPVSLYAATKKSNELMAYTYSHLYGFPATGLRFFTVYGPYGRPDMAYYKFTKSIIYGESIDVYNDGEMIRDFTYIDDIVLGVTKVIDCIPSEDKNQLTASSPRHQIYNIGNNDPISLRRFISAIEKACGRGALERPMPMQAGDVPVTYADVSALVDNIGFAPDTSIEKGINEFVIWYKNHIKQ